MQEYNKLSEGIYMSYPIGQGQRWPMLLSTGQASGRQRRGELTLDLLGLSVSAKHISASINDLYIVVLTNWPEYTQFWDVNRGENSK